MIVLSSSRTALEHYQERYDDVVRDSELTEQDYRDIVSAHDRHHRTLNQLGETLRIRGLTIRHANPRLNQPTFEDASLVISVGGDGTVLSTTRATPFNVPLLPLRSAPSSDGVLCRYDYDEIDKLARDVTDQRYQVVEWTLLKLRYRNQTEVALNDILIGAEKSMKVARFSVDCHGRTEEQRSSGLVISTGAGSTGWYKNIKKQHLKTGFASIDNTLSPVYDWAAQHFFTFAPGRREAWFTNRELLSETGVRCSQGTLTDGDVMHITSRMNVNGIISVDGDDEERLFDFPRGATATIELADQTLSVVHPATNPD